MAALLSTQSGAFSFFAIHASLGILTLEGQPPPRHLPTDSEERWRGRSQNAEACIHVDTGFLLVMLCISPFAKTSGNEKKVESKGILTC